MDFARESNFIKPYALVPVLEGKLQWLSKCSSVNQLKFFLFTMYLELFLLIQSVLQVQEYTNNLFVFC